MKARTKFIIVYILLPLRLTLDSFLVALYFRNRTGAIIVLLCTAVYVIVALKYGPRIITEYLHGVGNHDP